MTYTYLYKQFIFDLMLRINMAENRNWPATSSESLQCQVLKINLLKFLGAYIKS
jgi:hypothetical protein